MIVILLLALCLQAENFEAPALDGWERVSSDAHPPYNTVELVREEGNQFLRLRTQGGSTAVRGTKHPVDPDRSYRLAARVRLTSTKRNGAALTILWLNANGERISETRSEMLRTSGWTEIAVDVARAPGGAVAAAPRLDFDGDDVRGTCDFDQVTFGPFERLDVRPAGRKFAVFTVDEHPNFTVEGSRAVTVSLKTPKGVDSRTAMAPATVTFPPPGPGAHELTFGAKTVAVLIPNAWISPRDAVLPPATAASPEILALAGRSPSTDAPAVPNDSLEAVLKAQIARPGSPVTIDRLFVDADGNPTSALLALRATTDVLAGATPLPDPGLFPAGVRVAAFRKGETAVLALWSESGEIDVPVTLNPGARLYPPLGALRPLRAGERLRLGPLPLFLIGVDPLLLAMRLQLAGGDLSLQLNPATRTLRLHNPSRSQPLTEVRVRLLDMPAGWRISPRAVSAARIAPEGDLAEDLQIVLPAGESERDQELKFEATFVRNGKEQTVLLSRVVRLASAVRIESSVVDGPRPGSKKVTVRIVNGSDRKMTLAMRARLPHLPEQMELVRDLAPGASSPTFEYVVKDVHLTDPSRLAAEIDVQESVGARASAKKVLSLR